MYFNQGEKLKRSLEEQGDFVEKWIISMESFIMASPGQYVGNLVYGLAMMWPIFGK